MTEVKEKNKTNDLAFYSLMIILGVSVLYILGYLVYEMIFG
jgi:hypothetical protein